ncbi:MAG: hypothetical protein P8166_18320 [Candidatus Thiodiazotropha sp.]
MALAELLTVEKVFQLQDIGLTIVPDFPVPRTGWKNGAYRVRVVKPNGEQLDADANFHICHFNIRDPSVLLDRRWRVMISFPSMTKVDLPEGSKILGDPMLAITLL